MKYTLLFAAALMVVLAGCSASSSETPAENPPAPTADQSKAEKPADDSGSTTAVTFAQASEVLSACTPCHSGPGAKDGVDLSNYAGVAAQVTPNDAANSRIVKAMHGDPKQMPPTGALAADKIKVVEDWINAGAKE